jgi:hypothetical protein
LWSPFAGVLVHAIGTWDEHRLEASTSADRSPLVLTLYWVCWLMLAGVVMFFAGLRRGPLERRPQLNNSESWRDANMPAWV